MQKLHTTSALGTSRNLNDQVLDLYDEVVGTRWPQLKKMARELMRLHRLNAAFGGQAEANLDEELMAATYIACHEHLRNPKGSVLRRVMVVLRRNLRRQLPRTGVLPFTDDSLAGQDLVTSAEPAICEGVVLDLWRDQLNEVDAAIVSGLEVGDSQDTIAARLGISHQAVSKRIQRLRAELTCVLELEAA